MTAADMIIYWRKAAEKAEERVIEQREELFELRERLKTLKGYLEDEKQQSHKNYLEICRLNSEMEKRGTK